MKIYCVIPARGGSKRIPMKNLREFNGKPLIAYPIEAALRSKVFDSVFVSTDSKNIAESAERFGATVPYLRDESLSGNYIGTRPVVQDLITKLSLVESVVMCLYPTSMLITEAQIRLGIEKFMLSKEKNLY